MTTHIQRVKAARDHYLALAYRGPSGKMHPQTLEGVTKHLGIALSYEDHYKLRDTYQSTYVWLINKKLLTMIYPRARKIEKVRSWTNENVVALAKKYKTVKDLRVNDCNLYQQACKRDLLPQIFSDYMKRTIRKRVELVPKYAEILSSMIQFDCPATLNSRGKGTYEAAKRYGIDIHEFYEKQDDAQYLKGLLSKLFTAKLEEIAIKKDIG